MRIVVDQDEVLFQFVNKVLERWNERNGTDFRRFDVDCWHMEQVLGYDRFNRPADVVIDEWMAEPDFFADLEPMPGAVDGFNRLIELGHDVVVATSVVRQPNVFDGKRKSMQRRFPKFDLKNFFACSRKGLLTGDYLIDDGPHNIKDWLDEERGTAIVLDARWNQDVQTSHLCLRMHGWGDIVAFFEGIERVKRTLEDWRVEALAHSRYLYPNGVRF